MSWSLPSEPLPLAALVAGLALASPYGRRFVLRGSEARFRAAMGLLSVALSAAWIIAYLRGGPRIIDATTYLLEARTFASGRFGLEAADPATSLAGRFLVRDVLGSSEQLSPIFPPGYPAILAIFVLLGAPLALGPLLAFAATWLTAELSLHAAERAGLEERERDVVARTAALLATFSGALRYHTADTMSHGLCAVLVAAALVVTLRATRTNARKGARSALGVGLALGWLVATRPMTGLAAMLGCAGVVFAMRPPGGPLVAPRVWGRGALAISVGMLPGIAWLLLHQRSATGGWLHSSQSLYYALSDGPPGCFRLGFGEDIGCLEEHGDFVSANLPNGYDLVAAAKTTGRRLKQHAVDAMNAEPLAIFVAGPALGWALGQRSLRPLAAFVGLVVLAYAPFYFDGNYPGGGARFYADVLPVELALVATFVSAFRWRSGVEGGARRGAWLAAASLVGFSVRGHVDHELLRDREGGRPMFELGALREAGIDRGIVFVDTDHGFAIGHDPGARADRGGLEIARWRGDASDAWLVEARGGAPAFTYDYDLSDGSVRIAPWRAERTSWLEAESLLPPIGQAGGWASTRHHRGECAPPGRAIALRAAGGRAPRVELALPESARGRELQPHWVALRSQALGGASERVVARVRVIDGDREYEPSEIELGGAPCVRGKSVFVPARAIAGTGRGAAPLRVRVETDPGGDGVVALDGFELIDGLASGPLERAPFDASTTSSGNRSETRDAIDRGARENTRWED